MLLSNTVFLKTFALEFFLSREVLLWKVKPQWNLTLFQKLQYFHGTFFDPFFDHYILVFLLLFGSVVQNKYKKEDAPHAMSRPAPWLTVLWIHPIIKSFKDISLWYKPPSPYIWYWHLKAKKGSIQLVTVGWDFWII